MPTYLNNEFPAAFCVTADGIFDKGSSDQIKTVFQIDQIKKTIDVYWIADDGGEHNSKSDLTKSIQCMVIKKKKKLYHL